jgi:hypothetical protein
MDIEEAEERIDDCLYRLGRAVPLDNPANREFWACVIHYLDRSAEYLREEVAFSPGRKVQNDELSKI